MNTLLPILKGLSGSSVLVVGDIMLDNYVYGSVERISPEAPIPVLKIQKRKQMLGGAGNVLTNLNSLGSKAGIVGMVGNDSNAKKIIELLTGLSVKYNLIIHSQIATITKTRFISSGQQILRTDEEQLFDTSPDTEREIIDKVSQMLDDYNVVVLSDYKKGLLTKGVIGEIIRIAKGKNIPVFVDPKGSDYSIYRGATIIKPNHKELRDAFPTENIVGDEILFARKLIQDYEIDYCLITLGKDGMQLVSKESSKAYSAEQREVFDVSGAGDTVIATVAACYSTNASLEDSCLIANLAAGIVVTKAGTASVTPFEIENEIAPKGKIFTIDELTAQLNLWRRNDYKIGFTNGCFDIIHAGHINTLGFAKRNCNRLIVGLNTDHSVRKLKGPGRPINNEIERCLVMAELASVDGIVLFDDETPENLIKKIRPDILVKGGDYKKEEVVGFDFMRTYGGEVLLAPIVDNLSTSNIISKIQKE